MSGFDENISKTAHKFQMAVSIPRNIYYYFVALSPLRKDDQKHCQKR